MIVYNTPIHRILVGAPPLKPLVPNQTANNHRKVIFGGTFVCRACQWRCHYQTRWPTNGLDRISSPKVDIGPCPGMNAISSPKGHNLCRIEAIRVWKSPLGKSVLPIEPLNKTSPTTANFDFALKKTIWPGVWPGQWITCKISFPICTVSPSVNQRFGSKVFPGILPPVPQF